MRDFRQPKSTLGIRQEGPLQYPPLDVVNVITFIWRDFYIQLIRSSLLTPHLVWLSWKRCHVQLESNPKYWPPLFDSETLLVRFDKKEQHGVAPNQISIVSLHMVNATLPSVNINLCSSFRIVDFRLEMLYFLPGYSVWYSDIKLCVLQQDFKVR